jgi:hypothetical protein
MLAKNKMYVCETQMHPTLTNPTDSQAFINAFEK